MKMRIKQPVTDTFFYPKEKNLKASLSCMIGLFIGLFLSTFIVGCSNESSQKAEQKTYQVKPDTFEKTLFFPGTIQPLHEYTLTNPMEAVIETMHFHYGQPIKKDAVIFTLKSSELQKQYNDALTDYLKAKDAYTIARAKFVGTDDLWKSGLLSKNNYLSEKSSLNNARVSLMQATRKLTEMVDKTGDCSKRNFSSLSFAQFDKVRLALTSKHDNIFLKASGDGVLLYPPKSSEEKSTRLAVGTTVKSGQVLGLIGDLSGIRIEIDVPEVDIDKIKPGMKATIRAVAFPREVLQGELVAVNAQASSNTGSTLPSFAAIIEVKQLTKEQQGWIKVGMSATIELATHNLNKLLIPISAVHLSKGQSLVTIKDKSGHIVEKNVTTGMALADKVIIESGLKTGDVVVYD